MDKIRNIKHRLSLSVDKLSPTRKTKKDARKSHSWATEGTASPTAAPRKRPQSVPELDGLNSSPDSRTESSLDIEQGAVGSAMSSPEVSRPMSLAEEDLEELSSEGPPKKAPRREGRRSRPTPSATDDSSLMTEVMKEVEKITTVTGEFKEKVENAATGLKEAVDNSVEVKTEERLPLLKEEEQDNESEPAEAQSSVSTSSSNISSETATLVESQESNEDDDSSAFVSLSSESSAVVTTTTKMEIEEISTVTEQETKTVTKKESIYSKLKKVATKRDDSSGHKEPIYARIKPKLFLETSFKPIEPTSSKTSSPGIVKPEPIYSSIKPKPSSGATPLTPPPPESGISSPITPSSPTSPGGHVNPLSHFTAFCSGGTTVPKEPIYSKVTPKDQRGGTLPRDSKPPTSPSTDYSKAGPIYTQPVPPIPTSEPPYKTFNRSSSGSDYGKVTVRASEISPPSRPSVVTIHNPGYEATKRLKEEAAKAQQEKEMETKEEEKKEEKEEKKEEENKEEEKQEVIMVPPPPPPPALSQETQGSDSSIVLEQHDSDTESTGKNKLSRLVEELAQELEAVSRRVGYQGIDDDDTSKKEVLAKLLATYDVPKNLRRVEEADESEVAEAERHLVAAGISLDELRLVDEENTETVYADVPDYSHDEFVIALDDENDPKYQSLTRAFRKGFSRRSSRGDSPGKVSRRSVQVYMNVVNVLSALKVLLNSNSSKAAHVIGRMGTLARPYAQRVQHSLTDTTWIQRVIYHKSGHNGFDELRRYIKSGGEFCKELSAIMQERAELEATYAKGLQKLSSKLLKASRENMGTVNQAWQIAGAELEQEGDTHKTLATAITDDIVKPLRSLIETQHKIRKGVEGMVDKTTKNLHDWRGAESKAKKQCFTNCRDSEKIQDIMIEARLGRGKTLSDKEAMKMEKQRRKAEEAVQKSDLEYYTCCTRAERARLEWESAIYKGSNCFQTLEEDRLQSLKDLVVKYHRHIKEAAPKLLASVSCLDEPVSNCDVEKDIQTVINAKGTGENLPEQLLPDFYAEDMNNIMNRERRREALEKFVHMIKADLERERRGKQGVENLAKALQETPTFGGEESQQDVNDKLQHMKAMLAYLEAARYKVQCSLDEINNRPKMGHPLAKHIEVHRDKQGVTFSVLKVPPWVRGNSVDVSPASGSPMGSPNWNDRGTADGTSVQPDSDFERADKNILSVQTSNSVDTSSKNGQHSLHSTLTKKSSTLPKTTTSSSKAFVTFNTTATVINSCSSTESSSKGVFNKSFSSSPSLSSDPQQSSKEPEQAPDPPHRAFMLPTRYPSIPFLADEFSSQGSERDYQTAITNYDYSSDQVKEDQVDGTYYARPTTTGSNNAAAVAGRCKALYDYEANMYDELTIKTGDIINIHEKQVDGWWVGELAGVIGIFPATYVEEID